MRFWMTILMFIFSFITILIAGATVLIADKKKIEKKSPFFLYMDELCNVNCECIDFLSRSHILVRKS
ncbi:hypothetical protein MFLO_01130 [Listeria floridensis FSL S10-1187]|uniref:Uncharacterized protein n=1 Tax=Listeria floridensis FSL S10-1187 TaxID=1265817 RepID=A0ABN0RIS4_9LIST|nr:hypothetical protein MFLO_01130 [Listeria floridensis FSL S10-1187]